METKCVLCGQSVVATEQVQDAVTDEIICAKCNDNEYQHSVGA